MVKDLMRFANLFDLTGHVAIVTGAAGGNGAGIANALHYAGAVVVAADLVFRPVEIKENDHLSSEVDRMIMDVTDERSIKAVYKKVKEKYGKLDILVNNAGIIYKDPVDQLKMERFKQVTEVNLHGVVNCTSCAVPYMKEAGWGRIVNISSSQAFLASEAYSAYAASKAAVSHLTRVWGNELAEDNILVNALCPCYVKTPMMENSIKNKAAELHTDAAGGRKYFTDLIPTHRLLEIEEIGNWAVLLCGELGAAMTGSNVSITCGQVTL